MVNLTQSAGALMTERHDLDDGRFLHVGFLMGGLERGGGGIMERGMDRYPDAGEKSLDGHTPLTDQKGQGMQSENASETDKGPFLRGNVGVVVKQINVSPRGVEHAHKRPNVQMPLASKWHMQRGMRHRLGLYQCLRPTKRCQ